MENRFPSLESDRVDEAIDSYCSNKKSQILPLMAKSDY
jgi:hypothetical protein